MVAQGRVPSPGGRPRPRACDHRRMQEHALTWPEVARRLSAARTYWLGTTTPSGAPHAAPRSAMSWYMDDYFASQRRWSAGP